MEFIEGGVCAPKGFAAGAFAAGIKYKDRTDMAAIYSKMPCVYAGTFTKNVVKAAPVLWDKEILSKDNHVHLVIANSGIANAATGDEGMKACRETAEFSAETFELDPEEVLIASTGVIGFQMPMDRVKAGITGLKSVIKESKDSADDAAHAIMTTDTHDKQVAVTVDIGGTKVSIGAMAKGSGMIHPNMGTMLAFITTDCVIEAHILREMLSKIVVDTFNMVSVDGDTSTNDSCLVIANGAAKNPVISDEGEEYDIFYDALFAVCRELSMSLAGDGEGATALIESQVINAATLEDARVLAKSVITSSLTKAAIFGHDANWGRIMCALGYSGAEFDPARIDIMVLSENGEITLVENGKACDYSEEEATNVLSGKEVTIVSNMKMGDYKAVAWGCDLSYDYVKINADYRS